MRTSFKLMKSEFFLFVIFFIYCLSITFFSAYDLESSLMLSDGERFFISPQLVIFLFFLFSLSLFLFLRNKCIYILPLFVFYIFLVVVKLLSGFMSGYNFSGLYKSIFLVVLMVFSLLVVFYHLEHEKYFSFIVGFVVFYTTVSILFSIAIFFMGEISILNLSVSHFSGYNRLYGWYGNPNYLATVVAIGVFFLPFWHSTKSKKLAAYLIFCVALVWSASRGVIISVIAATVLYALISTTTKNFPKRFLVSIVFLFLLSICFTFYFYSWSEQEVDFLSDLLRLNSENIYSASGRVNVWTDAFKNMEHSSSHHLLFGHGFTSFIEIFGISAHSYYMKSLFEDGIIFFVLNMFFLMCVILKASLRMNFGKFSDHHKLLFIVTAFLLFRGITTPIFWESTYGHFIFLCLLIPFFIKVDGVLGAKK